MSLEGKSVISTGAAFGIGRASAQLFARLGMCLALLDRDEDGLHMTAQLLESMELPLLLCTDVADQNAVERALQTVKDQFGRVDVLMNNAAILADWGLPHEISTHIWDEVFAINLKGVIATCRAVVPAMSQGGTIINSSSICGAIRPFPMRAPYNITKEGIIAFTRDLAVAYGPML